ncbi:hypothetical protein ACQB60_22895 [Actinomycetota bacterium Odt1-20B]
MNMARNPWWWLVAAGVAAFAAVLALHTGDGTAAPHGHDRAAMAHAQARPADASDPVLDASALGATALASAGVLGLLRRRGTSTAKTASTAKAVKPARTATAPQPTKITEAAKAAKAVKVVKIAKGVTG